MTEPKKIPKRATITELARTGGGITHLSDQAIRRHIRENNIKADKKKCYNTQAVLKAILKSQARDKRNPGRVASVGSEQDAKIRLTRAMLQIEKLRVEIDILKGQYIPLEEHNRELAEYAGMVNAVFDQWISHVATVTRDAKLRGKAEELRDRARARLVKAIEGGKK